MGMAHSVLQSDANTSPYPIRHTIAAVPHSYYIQKGASANTTVKCVRFDGRSDPASSYGTTDPYLAGARYQTLLNEQQTYSWKEGACRSHIRERATGPRSVFVAHSGACMPAGRVVPECI